MRLKALCSSMLALAVTALAVFYSMWDGKQEYQALFLAGSALSFALIALVFVVCRILIRPLSNMVDAVKEMGESGLVGRIPENNGSVEIDSLARLINGLQEELENLNDELSEKVHKQNRELWDQAQRLQQGEEERAGLEQQLLQSQKMEAIGQLAGGVAHDFNNLLMLIMGNNSLAISQLPEDHPVLENLREIDQASEGAVSLTRQLLAFSRRQVLQMRVIDLNEVVARLEKMLGRLIGEDVVLETNFGCDAGQVRADAGQIEQVLMNLAINARDAMPTGGTLIIETQNVVIDETYTVQHDVVRPNSYGPYTMVAVTDTGTGMDADTMRRIFDPFFTTKARGKGTGLGLSTVYGIIKQSGGYIWVYSELDQGSVFKFYLPHADSDIRVEELPSTQMRVGGDETILLVEDDESVRKLCKHSLEQCGYTVLDSEDAMGAMKACQEHSGDIDLILTDVVMPNMNGPEMVELLVPIMPQSKVLYMSGYTDNAVLTTEVLEPGMNFLQKPFSLDSLAEKVRSVLDE